MSKIIATLDISTRVRADNGDEYLVHTHSPFASEQTEIDNHYTGIQSQFGLWSHLHKGNAETAIKHHIEVCEHIEEYLK